MTVSPSRRAAAHQLWKPHFGTIPNGRLTNLSFINTDDLIRARTKLKRCCGKIKQLCCADGFARMEGGKKNQESLAIFQTKDNRDHIKCSWKWKGGYKERRPGNHWTLQREQGKNGPYKLRYQEELFIKESWHHHATDGTMRCGDSRWHKVKKILLRIWPFLVCVSVCISVSVCMWIFSLFYEKDYLTSNI